MRRLSSRGNEARVKALEHNFTVPAVPRPRRHVRCISVSPGRLRSLHHPRKEDQRFGCNPLDHDHLKPSLGVLAPVSSYKKKRLEIYFLKSTWTIASGHMHCRSSVTGRPKPSALLNNSSQSCPDLVIRTRTALHAAWYMHQKRRWSNV